MGNLLSRRTWALTLGDMRMSSEGQALDVEFVIEKTDGREPNTCRLSVYNLTKARISTITTQSLIRIEAGYDTISDVIFVGYPKSIKQGRNRVVSRTTRSDVDRVTEIEAMDSGASYIGTRLDKSYSAGTRCIDVMRDAAKAMGVGLGNLDSLGTTLDRAIGPNAFAEGYVAHGTAWQVFDRLVRSRGMQWAIQDGTVQIRRAGQPVQTRSIVLEPGGGLIGSPEVDKDGYVNVRAHLIPGLTPGSVIVLRSEDVSGNYAIKRTRYTGSTFGDPWDAELMLRSY